MIIYNLRKVLATAFVVAAAVAFTACSDKDDDDNEVSPVDITISGLMMTSRPASYMLPEGFVYVPSDDAEARFYKYAIVPVRGGDFVIATPDDGKTYYSVQAELDGAVSPLLEKKSNAWTWPWGTVSIASRERHMEIPVHIDANTTDQYRCISLRVRLNTDYTVLTLIQQHQ